MSVLIVVEHDNQAPRENFRYALAAAGQLGGQIEALVIGENCRAVADIVSHAPGLAAVRVAENIAYKNGLAENCAPLIAEQVGEITHVIMAAGSLARMWLPRAAALADSQMISEIIGIEAADTFVRPIYAGNAFTTVQSLDAVKFLSIRTTAFEPVTGDADTPCKVTAITSGGDSGLTEFIGERVSALERPELTAAQIIISGGRGVGSADNFKLLEALADKLGAGIGASRAAVDEGYAPNDFQVGQTGKIVAPDLYMAVGISGAIQHLAGIRDSKCIVAINKDADAPIFEIADYGLVGDLFEIIPQLQAALEE
ncbi:FAD-binding protein [Candidatus Persebacteraceae bacterium Df01]|jgi:electron transfer flavoprotein alpha subunit|uniref:FAD-binding protein n=1 Tax=Candidatus Doriopsillibacter californiensis TaxID=2970740 RepID=A0ABT7QLK8_9GAMM|nr:FAD-binding protein [Candidatus Persebacteraceae bacterium Df01]